MAKSSSIWATQSGHRANLIRPSLRPGRFLDHREASESLAETCGLLRYSCGNLKLSRRDADDPLEVKGKMALVGETDVQGDLRQTELAVSPEELLRSFNATSDHILVRR